MYTERRAWGAFLRVGVARVKRSAVRGRRRSYCGAAEGEPGPVITVMNFIITSERAKSDTRLSGGAVPATSLPGLAHFRPRWS